MNCPECNVQLLMMERLGTQIDYCPQCRGVWLEKGKLDRIIERAEGERSLDRTTRQRDLPPTPGYDGHSHYGKHHDDHREHDGHRKKHGIFDLFD
jgi:Zn-finger nucleic acid-binding protein